MAVDSSPAVLEKGRELWHGKGACASCEEATASIQLLPLDPATQDEGPTHEAFRFSFLRVAGESS